MNVKTAVIVDDHPFMRAYTSTLLSSLGFEVVGMSGDGAQAIQLIKEKTPDLVILDINIPNMDGMEVISRIKNFKLSCKVLVMTSLPKQYYAPRALRAGAAGFVAKTDDLDELTKAIKSLMSGYTHFPLETMQQAFEKNYGLDEVGLLGQLSDREMEVLRKLANGIGIKEISEQMLLSNKTVSTYKARLIDKLKVKSVVDLADFAKRHNLI